MCVSVYAHTHTHTHLPYVLLQHGVDDHPNQGVEHNCVEVQETMAIHDKGEGKILN